MTLANEKDLISYLFSTAGIKYREWMGENYYGKLQLIKDECKRIGIYLALNSTLLFDQEQRSDILQNLYSRYGGDDGAPYNRNTIIYLSKAILVIALGYGHEFSDAQITELRGIANWIYIGSFGEISFLDEDTTNKKEEATMR